MDAPRENKFGTIQKLIMIIMIYMHIFFCGNVKTSCKSKKSEVKPISRFEKRHYCAIIVNHL